jgi:hypothetical protein
MKIDLCARVRRYYGSNESVLARFLARSEKSVNFLHPHEQSHFDSHYISILL